MSDEVIVQNHLDQVLVEGETIEIVTVAGLRGLPGAAGTQPPLSDNDPDQVDGAGSGPGDGISAARWNHKHNLAMGSPVNVGLSNEDGIDPAAAHADHQHDVPKEVIVTRIGEIVTPLAVNGQRITNGADPIADTDFVIKSYADVSGGGGELIFRPNEPNPKGNVFTDFALLEARAQQIIGPKTIVFDCTLATGDGLAHVPAKAGGATWNLGEEFSFAGIQWQALYGLGVLLEDGVKFNRLPTFLLACGLYSQSSQPIVELSDTNDRFVFLQNYSFIQNNGSAPFFVDTNSANNTLVILQNASGLYNDGARIFTSAGSMYVYGYDFSYSDPNTFYGTLNTELESVSPAARINVNQTGGATMVVNKWARSLYVHYDDVTFEPQFGSDNVQDVLNVIKAKFPALYLKEPVRYASPINVASLTGTPVIDGHQTNNGDRVLLTAQTASNQNGPWIVGTPWTRPLDFKAGMEFVGTVVLVESGNSLGNSLWWINNTGQVGASNINMVKLPGQALTATVVNAIEAVPTLYFSPGVVATVGNVYKTWAEVVAAATVIPKLKKIYFDSTGAPGDGRCHIPSGTHNLGTVEFWGIPSQAQSGLGVQFDDGAKLTSVPIRFHDIHCLFNSTQNVTSVSGSGLRATVISGLSNLRNNGGISAFVDRVGSVNISVQDRGQITEGSGFMVFDSTTFSANQMGQSVIENNTCSVVSGTPQTDISDDSICLDNAFLQNLRSDAQRVAYNDGASPAFGSTNVQGALDAAKALLAGVVASGGPTASRPGSPTNFFHYFDTDIGFEVIWNPILGDWVNGAGVPS